MMKTYYFGVGISDDLHEITESHCRAELELFLRAFPDQYPGMDVNAAQAKLDRAGSFGGCGFWWRTAAEAQARSQRAWSMSGERTR
jgi:hypothetical protein